MGIKDMILGKKPEENKEHASVPRHIAVIMDGNGRWAKKRGLPRTAGHKVGAETFRNIATYCKDIGVQYLTVYAFSTENWKRSTEEVGAIMGLLKRYLLEAVDTMEKDHIRLRFFGDMTPIDPELRAKGLQYNMPVHIGKNCWLGAGVIVMPGVTIGDNTVIGAGSIVTKDIPSGVVAVGNPCRVLREVGQHDREYYWRDKRIDPALFSQK